MSKDWKWKVILVLGITLLGFYLLIPTFFKFDEIREATEEVGLSPPFYVKLFPKKSLNLGLDLRGGIYIEMEVEVENALKRKLDLAGTDIEGVLKDKNIGYEKILPSDKGGTLSIRARTSDELQRIKAILASDFKETLKIFDAPSEEGFPTAIVGFNEKYKSYLSGKVVDQALETVRNRIDRFGVSEPSITRIGDARVSIELPGLKDPDRAINIIKKTGQLEFKIIDGSIAAARVTELVAKAKADQKLPDNYTVATVEAINGALKGEIPEESEVAFQIERDPKTRSVLKGIPFLLKRKAEVTGDMLQNTAVRIHDNQPYVDLTFDKRGAKLFADLTTANVGKPLAIVLDGNIMKAPVIQEPIPNGRAQITLGFGDYYETVKEAEDLSLVLQEGALPATLHEATKTVVGPSLGHDSIKQGIRASLISALAVMVFMIAYYKLSGVWANMALVANVVLLLAILALFQATLTLPGIAGIVLTIGMAVDANVIINERIKEELASGRTPKAAVDGGYSNALSAVVDGNLTTLIAGIVLYQFGTGPIRGFAVTLSIGILTTLFTAILITRLIFDYRVAKSSAPKLSI